MCKLYGACAADNNTAAEGLRRGVGNFAFCCYNRHFLLACEPRHWTMGVVVLLVVVRTAASISSSVGLGLIESSQINTFHTNTK